MEGHGSFLGTLNRGAISEAKIITEDGARLIEGMLLGRAYSDAPIITARICGICPVVHALNSIETMEKAFKVKVTPTTTVLRKIMMQAQFIHSHGLHLFFLAAPDFYDLASSLKLVHKFPREAQASLKIRDYGVKIVEKLGGRTVHPVACEVGGFKKWPSKKDLEYIKKEGEKMLPEALVLAKFFCKLKYPSFERKTTYVSLYDSKEYEIYQGKIKTSQDKILSTSQFYKAVLEFQRPHNPLIKRTSYIKESYMLGALARLNNNHKLLNKEAKKVLKSTKIKLPSYNSFHNVLAQAIELVHNIEEVIKLVDKVKLSEQKNVKYKVRAGKGEAAMEAPRGILYDMYELDSNGKIKNCNIMTPTAQFLDNLEKDLAVWLPSTRKFSPAKRENEIKKLIRAYDPCISCATH